MNDGRKLILASEHLRPDAAICDPRTYIGFAANFDSRGAGMDVLTHCIEAIMSPINDPCRSSWLDGIEKIVCDESLINACKDGQDLDARWNMMMASTEGAMAFTKGLEQSYSMSHAIGANQELRLHHGTLTE